MYVRSKTISERKYLYLVEGSRFGKRVQQTSVCYLGPLWKLYTGVPVPVRRKVESKIGRKADWESITESITKIPISFEELERMKSSLYSQSLEFRKKKRPRGKNYPFRMRDILGRREKGELRALAKLADIGFKERFEQIDEKTYRLR
jgi:hypothetical protein